MRSLLLLIFLPALSFACDKCEMIEKDFRNEINFLSNELYQREVSDCTYSDHKYLTNRLSFYYELHERYFR